MSMMNRALSSCARSFLLPRFSRNPYLSLLQLTSSIRPTPRSYASQSDSSNSKQTPQNNNGSVDVEDVSNEELKRRIERYSEGDAEAIPSIFEAILSRKLAGKHDESDDELMEEIRRKNPGGCKEEVEEEEND